MRREIPTLIGAFFGLMMIVTYFVPATAAPRLSVFAGDVQQWALIVVAFAYVLGGMNVLKIHGEKVARLGKDWPYSLVTVVSLLIVLLFGFLPERWHGGIEIGSALLWIYDSTYSPLATSVYALLCFFIASASYRAFRVRNWQAGALAVTALVVMAGAVPLTHAALSLVTPEHAGFFADLRVWIMEVLQNAGKRAILIGVALGTIATGFKIIIGIERPYGRD